MKVREIMQSQVVSVRPETPVRELVQILARERISGAPVVDGQGAVIGVVSASDVLALAAYGSEAHTRDPIADEEGATDEESAWYFRTGNGDSELDLNVQQDLEPYQVADIMTPAAFSVRSEDSVPDLARFLLRGRIHRALVIDDGRLVGIATTYDVLNAVAAGVTP